MEKNHFNRRKCFPLNLSQSISKLFESRFTVEKLKEAIQQYNKYGKDMNIDLKQAVIGKKRHFSYRKHNFRHPDIDIRQLT